MELTGKTFEELAAVIHRISGLVVSSEKAYLVRHRLAPLVKQCGCDDFEGLVKELKAIGGYRLHDAIIEAITTKETSFFRDSWFYDALREHVLGNLGGPGRKRLRIWSAGCSTGQEPYSLAMLFREMADDGGMRDREATILASDLSAEALAAANAGRYTGAQLKRGVSEGRLKRHFRRVGEHWQVDLVLHRQVAFRRMDLLNLPADLGTFDLILCRNVMIYFDLKAREQVVKALARHLEAGGWLGLGSAESLYGIESRLEMVKLGRAVLYRKPAK